MSWGVEDLVNERLCHFCPGSAQGDGGTRRTRRTRKNLSYYPLPITHYPSPMPIAPCPIPKNRKSNIDIIPNHATSMPVAPKWLQNLKFKIDG
ncbi:hypothetical protein PI95_011995 [Hassallia byssoidea VB512170]|uniref:Uncharacterized protein n=1 Tax=Hassallia byssoidea VB512170 TaxID=1304833 RepID=A0A846H7F5_9CYAN|nr:hypothetical protein [Hassalia byssoidea]NEU73266.1 hypothetical protein [Hassalia byssoidea VB512170]